MKFINEKLGPNDLMAVFVAGSRLLMVQNFTNSKSKLLNAVSIATDSSGNVISLSTTDRSATRADISFDQAATGNVAVNPGAGGAAVGEAISSLDAFGADVNRTFDNLVDQFSAIALVQSLLALMKVYSRIPGRKAVLLYSEGFAVNSTVQGTFDAVLGTANRNNFSFYTVDAAGLRSVPHAGETTGPQTIWDALNHLGAERIGHGTSAVQDLLLMEHLAAQRIPLEVCPTSNIATKAVARLEEHPIRAMHEAGLVITINSDDPPMFATSLTVEYEVAARLLDLDAAGVAELALAARPRLHDTLAESEPMFRTGKYFMSPDIGLADCMLLPLLWRLPAAGISLHDLGGAIDSYAQRLFNTPLFQRTLSDAERAMAA